MAALGAAGLSPKSCGSWKRHSTIGPRSMRRRKDADVAPSFRFCPVTSDAEGFGSCVGDLTDAWKPDEEPGRGNSRMSALRDPVGDCGDDGEAKSAAIGACICPFETRRQPVERVARQHGAVIRDDQFAVRRQGHVDRCIFRAVPQGVFDEVRHRMPKASGSRSDRTAVSGNVSAMRPGASARPRSSTTIRATALRSALRSILSLPPSARASSSAVRIAASTA